ncbi:MAG: M15 family metallopeptidase [Microbacterium sp.]
MDRVSLSSAPKRVPLAQHAAPPRRRGLATLALTFVAVTGLALGAAVGHLSSAEAGEAPVASKPSPAEATDLPAPAIEQVASVSPCDRDEVTAAVDGGDPSAVIAAFGGAEAMRTEIVHGTAPCVSLKDGRWPWMIVNKHRTLDPIDYSPDSLAAPARVVEPGLQLRTDATRALDAMVDQAIADGAGSMSLTSGYRSHGYQESLFSGFAAQSGAQVAEMSSARPGYSEHQTGLAADLVACDVGCGSMDDFGGTPQSEWLLENGWRYGWIVRYEQGHTEVTGYEPEPWHVRYVGKEIAKAYHEGGYHTLEEFFGLEAAPDYE